jgi:hypothetical protein
MKRYHIAALAAVGWYLMAPPNKDFPTSASLSQWQIKFSFDQARDCEIALGNTLANVKLKLKHGKHYSDLRWYESWQCIASDDPRLKEK